jgi:hypothetical protein
MKIARRFSLEQRTRIIAAQLPWKAVELLARSGISSADVDAFLLVLGTAVNPTIDQCFRLLHSVLYPASEASEASERSMSANKELMQSFLKYLEDTAQAMHRYLEGIDET